MRRAGALTDEALAVANRMTVPGVSVGAIYGEMLNAMLRSGGDVPCGRWPMVRCGHSWSIPRSRSRDFAAAIRVASLGGMAGAMGKVWVSGCRMSSMRPSRKHFGKAVTWMCWRVILRG